MEIDCGGVSPEGSFSHDEEFGEVAKNFSGNRRKDHLFQRNHLGAVRIVSIRLWQRNGVSLCGRESRTAFLRLSDDERRCQGTKKQETQDLQRSEQGNEGFKTAYSSVERTDRESRREKMSAHLRTRSGEERAVFSTFES